MSDELAAAARTLREADASRDLAERGVTFAEATRAVELFGGHA